MIPGRSAVVEDTMVVSALINAHRHRAPAAAFRETIAGRPIVVSFATVTEVRYGALKAGWGDLRRRALERDLTRLVVVQPDDQLMRTCAEVPLGISPSGGHGVMKLAGTAVPTRAVRRGRGCCEVWSGCTS